VNLRVFFHSTMLNVAGHKQARLWVCWDWSWQSITKSY